jgi:hypothetical protein
MLLEYGMTRPSRSRTRCATTWSRPGSSAARHQGADLAEPAQAAPTTSPASRRCPARRSATPAGHPLDIQDVANATLRSLVNNLSISSGPQVGDQHDRLAPDEDGESSTRGSAGTCDTSDPMAQQHAGAGQLLPADVERQRAAAGLSEVQHRRRAERDPEVSSRAARRGGAGRTASGLAMLMGNASKILQTVAAEHRPRRHGAGCSAISTT